MIINRITTAGVLIAAATVAGAPAEAQQRPQMRPMSINEWLQAERNNANMQRAVEEYERARYGTATPQQAYQPQPAYQPPSYGQPPQPAYRTYAPEQAQAPTGAPQAAPAQPVAPQPLTPNEPPGYHQPRYPQQQVQPQSPPYPYQAQPGGQLPQYSNQPNTYQVPPDALEKIDREYNPTGSTGTPLSGIYVNAHLGLPLVPQQAYSDSTSTGGADFSPLGIYADGALGYKFNDKFSVEFEGSYQQVDYEEARVSGGVSVIALLVNGQYTHQMRGGSSWYGTVGMGLAQHKISDADVSGTSTSFDGSDTVLAYQLGGGLLIPIDGHTSLDLGYKYFGTNAADISSTYGDFTAEYSSHVFMLGLNYQL